MAKSQLLKDLISVGKKKGYLTYDDINKKISGLKLEYVKETDILELI